MELFTGPSQQNAGLLDAQLIHIDDASLNAWRQNDLMSVIEKLSREAPGGNHHRLANLALVRARLKQWDLAEQDARASVGAQPTVLAHIAMSIALTGQGKLDSAKQEFNRVFLYPEAGSACLLLLVKSIIIFEGGGHGEAARRVVDLAKAVADADKPLCRTVQAYMQLLVGQTLLNKRNYQAALQSFATAGALAPFLVLPALETISLMFGWDFGSLPLTIFQQTCEALYAASQINEAIESLRTMLNEFEPIIQNDANLSKWLENFKRGCVDASEAAGDSALASGNHEEAIMHYTAALSLDPPSRADIIMKRDKVQVAIGAVNNATNDLDKKPTRFRILVIGRANAGKTTLLQRVCKTNELPILCDREGNRIDVDVKGRIGRGEHDIEHEISFKSNDRFVFHDSRGFEAGSEDELKTVQSFIERRAKEQKLSDRLDAIWYCISLKEGSRPITVAEEFFFNNYGTGDVPVIVIFTHFDALHVVALGRLMSEGKGIAEARPLAVKYAEEMFENSGYIEMLKRKKFPPKDIMHTGGMNEEGADCSELISRTVAVLDNGKNLAQQDTIASPLVVRITDVTIESVQNIRRLISGDIQIDGLQYTLICDEDGALRQQFPSPLTLSSDSHVELHYKKSWSSRTETESFNVPALFANADMSRLQDLSVVQGRIRVSFRLETTDAAALPHTPPKAAVPQSSENLVPTTQSMFRDCPRFRVLVIGKSGVGKSNLIKAIFGVDEAHMQDFERGRADIHEGLVSPVNKRLVLHDSLGFEPGDKDKYQIIKHFIQSRQTGPLADRLHAVWFCIQTPYAGGRLLGASAEDFFRSKQQTLGTIPLIVVYTKLDMGVNALLLSPSPGDLDDESYIKNAPSKARSNVQERHKEITQVVGDSVQLPYATVSIQTGYEYTLRELTDLTHREVGTTHIPEAQVTSALANMAQRIDPLLKIQGSIDIGRQRYWRTLESSPNFAGHAILDCLSVIHVDIVALWNFNDPASHLLDDNFKELVVGMVKEAQTATLPADANIIKALGEDSSIDPSSSILDQVYQNGKDVQQIFMTFIVDLTRILETLFALCAGGHEQLTRRAIKQAFKVYHDSAVMRQGRARILEHRETDGRDTALETIESLIQPQPGGSSYANDLVAEVGRLDRRQLNLFREPDEDW